VSFYSGQGLIAPGKDSSPEPQIRRHRKTRLASRFRCSITNYVFSARQYVLSAQIRVTKFATILSKSQTAVPSNERSQPVENPAGSLLVFDIELVKVDGPAAADSPGAAGTNH
jgi:hypothetical protein